MISLQPLFDLRGPHNLRTLGWLCAAVLVVGCAGGGPEPGTKLAVRESPQLGRYVTDVNGRPIYVPLVDAPAAWSCTGDCAGAWVPVSGPTLNSDVDEPAIQIPLIKTRQRADGGLQLTYADRPLYYPGQGASDAPAPVITDQFGTWSLLFPHGEPMAPPP